MKILMIVSRVPYPLEKGDKLRAFHQIRYLSEKHEIHLFCLNDSVLHPEAQRILSGYCKSIQVFNLSRFSVVVNVMKSFMNGKPFQAGYFYNSKAQRLVDRMISDIQPDHIYCQLIRTASYAKKHQINKTIDYQDVFSKGIARRSEFAAFWLKPVLRLEYSRLLKYEQQVFGEFNNKTIISRADRDLIPHPDRDRIHIIPNGVDREYFQPSATAKTWDLLFTGNMGYAPNIQSARYLAEEILPLVMKKKPGIKICIAGASPDPSVQALESPNVVVVGWMNDIRDAYNKSRIFIAPMLIGTGLQNKLLEAMSMKMPCITSELANRSLMANPGSDVLIGSSPDEYATHIIRLLEEEDYAASVAENGFIFVRNNYSWEESTRKLEEIIINT